MTNAEDYSAAPAYITTGKLLAKCHFIRVKIRLLVNHWEEG